MPDKNDMNLLLDAALRSYADPGPDSGFEQRILRNVAEQDAARTRHPWRMRLLWAAGASLAAVCLLLVFIFSPRLKTVPHTASTQPPLERHPPESNTAAVPPRSQPGLFYRHKLGPHSIAQPAPAPKLAVFPTPAPLSAQEQALVRLVVGATAEQRNDLIAAQQQGDKPLRIAAISIPSLKPPEEGKE